MDKSTVFFCQLLIFGTFLCLASAGSIQHKRNLIAEYHWPEPDPEINQFPHETTCHYYYLVLSEEDITVTKCPGGKLFDYIEHKCVEKDKARCWSHHFGRIKHHHYKLKSRDHFRCPYAWGKYPDTRDCTRYFVCLSGKVKHKKCAPYEHFDRVTRKCVAAIEGVCADETDIGDPHYKCPRSWGSFAFDDDCSKYYECLEKRPSLRACPPGTLFHEIEEACKPAQFVHCESRHNPYRTREEVPKIEKIKILHPTKEPIADPTRTKPEIKATSESEISTVDPTFLNIKTDQSSDADSKSTQLSEVSSTIDKGTTGAAIGKVNELTTKEKVLEPEVKMTNVPTIDPNSIVTASKPSISDNTKVTQSQSESSTSSQGIFLEIPKISVINPNELTTEKEITVSEVRTMSEASNTILSKEKSSSAPGLSTQLHEDPSTKAVEVVPSKATEHTTQPQEKEHVPEAISVSGKSTLDPNSIFSDIKLFISESGNSQSTVKDINEDIISKDSTSNETADDEMGNTDEFIEVSTSAPKSSSDAPVTETIIVDSSLSTKAKIAEIKVDQTTPETPQATTPAPSTEDCSPKDPTCLTGESGQIIRCPAPDGMHPYPGDERRYLICKKSSVQIRLCGGSMIFNNKEKKCVAHLIF